MLADAMSIKHLAQIGRPANGSLDLPLNKVTVKIVHEATPRGTHFLGRMRKGWTQLMRAGFNRNNTCQSSCDVLQPFRIKIQVFYAVANLKLLHASRTIPLIRTVFCAPKYSELEAACRETHVDKHFLFIEFPLRFLSLSLKASSIF